MSQEQFVKFYQEFLPTKPDLEKQLNSIGDNQKQFASTAVKLGSSNGFKFGEDDVREVMAASQANFMKSKAGLSDEDLEAVVGGATTSLSSSYTVSLSSLSSPINQTAVKDLGGLAADYGMCCW